MSEKELATEFSSTSEPFKSKDLNSADNQNSRDSAHLETQESPDSSKSDRKSKKNQMNKKEQQGESKNKEQVKSFLFNKILMFKTRKRRQKKSLKMTLILMERF